MNSIKSKRKLLIAAALMSVTIAAGCNANDIEPKNQSLQNPNDITYDPVSFGPGMEQEDTGNRNRNDLADNNPDNFLALPEQKDIQRYRPDSRNIRPNTEQSPTPASPEQSAQNAEGINAIQAQVIELTNAARQKNGLSPLSADAPLSEVAQIKSEDMRDNDYFSHTSPNYGSPFDMLKQFDIDYSTAAENIAAGQTSPEEVVNSWMNSAGHRRNILNPNITHIGVGFAKNNGSGGYWTQMFIGK